MSNESMRRDAWKIIRKTLKEAMPDQAVEKALRARSFTKPVTLFSIGKAAWQMASAAERSLGNQIKQGIVLTKYGHSKGEIPRCEILEAGHADTGCKLCFRCSEDGRPCPEPNPERPSPVFDIRRRLRFV